MAFNLDEEMISGYLVSSNMKQIWAIQMDLATKLLKVCKKYNLHIWAEGGTLLGAIRHGGFIPWDDDMDFAMMREDYNKLIEVGPREFKEPYFFQSIYTDNTWGGMAKIRRSDTAMIDDNYYQLKERNSGIFIDVFVLDGIPSDELIFKKECVKINRKRRLLTRKGAYRPDFKGIRALLRTFYVSLYFKIHDYRNEQIKIVNLLSRNNIHECEYCALIDFYAGILGKDYSKIHKRKCSWYNETIELSFCDMTLPVPKAYHELLTCLYGDYMTPVKGGALHSMLLIDCARSYKEVLSEMK